MRKPRNRSSRIPPSDPKALNSNSNVSGKKRANPKWISEKIKLILKELEEYKRLSSDPAYVRERFNLPEPDANVVRRLNVPDTITRETWLDWGHLFNWLVFGCFRAEVTPYIPELTKIAFEGKHPKHPSAIEALSRPVEQGDALVWPFLDLALFEGNVELRISAIKKLSCLHEKRGIVVPVLRRLVRFPRIDQFLQEQGQREPQKKVGKWIDTADFYNDTPCPAKFLFTNGYSLLVDDFWEEIEGYSYVKNKSIWLVRRDEVEKIESDPLTHVSLTDLKRISDAAKSALEFRREYFREWRK